LFAAPKVKLRNEACLIDIREREIEHRGAFLPFNFRPSNGFFNVITTSLPAKRSKSASFFSGRSSPGDDTSSRS
jgi:hypothetical protein